MDQLVTFALKEAIKKDEELSEAMETETQTVMRELEKRDDLLKRVKEAMQGMFSVLSPNELPTTSMFGLVDTLKQGTVRLGFLGVHARRQDCGDCTASTARLVVRWSKNLDVILHYVGMLRTSGEHL